MKFTSLFKYNPQHEHEFTLEPIKDNTVDSQNTQKKEDKKVYKSLNQNNIFLTSIYNKLINSDIIFRNFTITLKSKKYPSLLIYVDGMVNAELINNFILKPLMFTNDNNIKSNNKLIIKKLDTTSLEDQVYNTLIPQNSVSKEKNFTTLISDINSGNCVLFIDTLSTAFSIDVKGFKQRNIEKPSIETVIKGPQEAFVENIRTNTSILRRIINSEHLIIENTEIGEINKTKCALCYMKNIANNDLIAEARFRLNNLAVDSIISSGELEQLIQDNANIGIPQILSTERPDKCVKAIMQGRVIILLNNNPYALIVPSVFTDFLSSPEDSNQNPLFTNFLKLIRLLALIITLLLPGMYIAITNFHQELFPTELLFSILVARENVPFPIIFELLLMEISFELIREGGLRTPSAIGSTLGIVGALILGDAAVSANIVSPILIIIVAITGLSSFVMPNFSFGFHLRVYRFGFTILGYIAGFLGIGIGIYIYIALLCSLKSFGVQYTSPISCNISNHKFKYFVSPFWKQEFRDSFLATKKQQAQNKISMKWRTK